MMPIVENVCHRCESPKIETHENGIFTCKECGKADKSHTLKLKFQFPQDDGTMETVTCRHLAREMAGFMSENIATPVAVGLSRAVEAYGAKMPPQVAKAVTARSVGACFDTMFHMISAFLPSELQQELAKTNAAISRANTIMEAEREKQAKEAEHGPTMEEAGGDAAVGPAGGAGHGSVEPVGAGSVADPDQPPPRGDLQPAGGPVGGEASGGGG